MATLDLHMHTQAKANMHTTNTYKKEETITKLESY